MSVAIHNFIFFSILYRSLSEMTAFCKRNFQNILLKENMSILILLSPKLFLVVKVQVIIISDVKLSEAKIALFVYITGSQMVNSPRPGDAYMRQ